MLCGLSNKTYIYGLPAKSLAQYTSFTRQMQTQMARGKQKIEEIMPRKNGQTSLSMPISVIGAFHCPCFSKPKDTKFNV
jgi:hypothetical protein